MRETTLSANQWLDQAKRLNFAAQTSNERRSTLANGVFHMEFNTNKWNEVSNFTIHLNPMEIRTFIIELNNNIWIF